MTCQFIARSDSFLQNSIFDNQINNLSFSNDRLLQILNPDDEATVLFPVIVFLRILRHLF
jgi:hypothetical protein